MTFSLGSSSSIHRKRQKNERPFANLKISRHLWRKKTGRDTPKRGLRASFSRDGERWRTRRRCHFFLRERLPARAAGGWGSLNVKGERRRRGEPLSLAGSLVERRGRGRPSVRPRPRRWLRRRVGKRIFVARPVSYHRWRVKSFSPFFRLPVLRLLRATARKLDALREREGPAQCAPRWRARSSRHTPGGGGDSEGRSGWR